MSYQVEVSFEEHVEFSTFLHNMIKEFNNMHSIYHQEIRKEGSVQPINIMVSDDHHNWIGGITAEVYWNWLDINHFWFREDYRGQGLGSMLLKQAEEIARQKGAGKAKLTTFDFQARSFYELHGYTVVGEITDYPPGSSYYTMVKEL